MVTFNGFEMGKVYVFKGKKSKRDKGHSAVEYRKRYALSGPLGKCRHWIICQCGKEFSGWERSAVIRRHNKHVEGKIAS